MAVGAASAGGRVRAGSKQGEPLAMVSRYLDQVRERTGADAVVFWRFADGGDIVLPTAWSTASGGPPGDFDAESHAPLVAWSARQRIVHTAGDGPTPQLVAAPVAADERSCHGALSVSARAGLAEPREWLKTQVPGFAAHVALLLELLRERGELELHNGQTSALLQASQDFQSNRSLGALGRAICTAALRVSPATRAALVRWDSASTIGAVQGVSPNHVIDPGGEVSESSLAGGVCRNRLPQVWEDARSIDSCTLFGDRGPQRNLGSLGIVPLMRGQEAIGAIVLEGDEPGDVSARDARHVGLLAALAAVSLEAVWEMEEVARRAHTDQLTGLANRRSFDEHFARMTAEVDRYGGTMSIVVADVDFFKRVNDTYGHEAGDAVLRAVAAMVRDRARSVDVCARFGGEEIALLLPQTPMTGAFEVAERLRRAIASNPIRHGGREIPVSASFGVAGYPESAHTREALFAAADRALYRAKGDGRNCVKCAPVIASSKMG
jgi:diguanylate cyclase (GGDEF)-like protein